MKKTVKVLGIIALITVIGFWAACNNGGGGTPAGDTPKDFRNITATEIVSEIKIGWNLGNTLDCPHVP